MTDKQQPFKMPEPVKCKPHEYCAASHCQLVPIDQVRAAYEQGRAEGLRAPEDQGEKDNRVIVDCYAIPATKRYADEIKIQRARQLGGPDLWKVSHRGNALNQDGEWEWEPMPSSRDGEFLARCRFASAEDAIRAAIDSTKGGSHG